MKDIDPFEEGDLVFVVWDDAGSKDTWWDSGEISEWAQSNAWLIENVGFVTYQDNDCIVVSGQRAINHKPPQFAENMRIPRRMIRSIQRLSTPQQCEEAEPPVPMPRGGGFPRTFRLPNGDRHDFNCPRNNRGYAPAIGQACCKARAEQLNPSPPHS